MLAWEGRTCEAVWPCTHRSRPIWSSQRIPDTRSAKTPDDSTRHSGVVSGATLTRPSPVALERPLIAVTDEATSVDDKSSELISKSPGSNVACTDASSTSCSGRAATSASSACRVGGQAGCAHMEPAGAERWYACGRAPRRAPASRRLTRGISRCRSPRDATTAAFRRCVMPARASWCARAACAEVASVPGGAGCGGRWRGRVTWSGSCDVHRSGRRQRTGRHRRARRGWARCRGEQSPSLGKLWAD